MGGSQIDARSNMWILDIGASQHMVFSKAQLIEAKSLDVAMIVILYDKQSLKTMHQGQATIPSDVKLSDVLYILSLKENIFLVSMV